MKEATQHRPENSFSELAGGAPHSIEAEQGLLGAILINNEAYGVVSDADQITRPFRANPSANLQPSWRPHLHGRGGRGAAGEAWRIAEIEPEEWRHRR